MKFKILENLGRELRDTVLRLLRDYSEALILAVLMAVVLRTFVIGAYRISNATMEPNLMLGDFVLGYKLPFGFNVPFTETHIGQHRPNRGDLIIFKCPNTSGQNCVKRVVGLSGDRIEIRKQRLIINGEFSTYQLAKAEYSSILNSQDQFEVLEEKWGKHSRNILISESAPSVDFGPFVVPRDTVFVLGDNRDYSEDSRHWGTVNLSLIESRVFLVWFSVEWILTPDGEYRSHLRWERLLKRVNF